VIALGWIWILDGVLQLQPSMFSRSSNGFLATVLQYNTMGRPNVLTDLIGRAVRLTYGTETHQILFNALSALVQLGIGIGLLLRRSERPALIASACWAVVPWVVGEALGQMLFPQTTMAVTGAPGAALIYVVLSLALLQRRGLGSRRDLGSYGDARSAIDSGLLGRSGGLVLWVLAWAGTGLLELEHANWAPDALGTQLTALARGEPSWLAGLDRSLGSAALGHGTEVALALLLVQVWVGVAVLRPTTRDPALAVGIALSLVYWVLGQNFGGLLTGTATDPNLGPLMVLFALALWPRPSVEREQHTRRERVEAPEKLAAYGASWARSASTIISTSSVKPTSVFQPSWRRARDGSPTKRSTSAGRKNCSSTTTCWR
jgi:hypothetical protein